MSRLVSVKVNYPPGLEAMVHSFKLCATARLFLQDLIPHVEAGIFLDNDIVVMDDLSLLWDRFDLFSSETAMAMAPVEAHYGAMVMVRDFDLICITSRRILDLFDVFYVGITFIGLLLDSDIRSHTLVLLVLALMLVWLYST